MTAEAKKKRAARNAWALLFRKDARSARRCKYWLRQYGFPEGPKSGTYYFIESFI